MLYGMSKNQEINQTFQLNLAEVYVHISDQFLFPGFIRESALFII